MDIMERRRAADALRAIKRCGEGWFSLSDAVLGRPAPRDEVVARLADLIDPGEDTTCDVYDLLPDDEHEHLWWAKSVGGVDAVYRQYLEADNRRVELCSALGIDTDTGWSDAMAELDRRLMPDGMEWPKVDGKPVDFVTGYEPSLGVLEAVSIYNNGACEVMGHDGIIKNVKEIHVSTPKMLDVDGAEIRVGDTVYLLPGDWCDKFPLCCCREWEAMKVLDLSPNHDTGRIECRSSSGSVVCYPYPSQLTHRAPVLAADGRPLRDGEHVWHVETGTELVVKELPKPGEYQAVVVFAPSASHLTSFDPDQLTHERPESKCRDCAHWQKDPTADNMGVCWFFYHEYGGEDCYAARRADIGACEEFMPRASALAERERGE